MQKKNVDVPLKSKSTESVSAYAPPSIGKINIPEHKVVANKALAESTKKQFAENPIFSPNNPNSQKNKDIYFQNLKAKGFDTSQLGDTIHPSPEKPYGAFQSIVDASKDLWTGIKQGTQTGVDLAKNLVEGSATGVNTGLETFNQGVKTVINATGDLPSTESHAEIATKGLLQAGTGIGGAALAGATVTVPEMAAFTAGSDAIKKTANSVLPEYEAKKVNDLVDFPFQAVSKTAEALGFDPKKHENWNMLLKIGDFAAIALGAKGYEKIKTGDLPTPIQSMKDLQALSEKAANGQLSPLETNQFQAVSEAVKNNDVSLEDIKTVAEDKRATDVVDKITEMQDQVKEGMIKVADVIDKPVIYNGKRGNLVQEGQTLEFHPEGENKIFEIGNIDELKNSDINNLGIQQEKSVVETNDNGGLVIRGKDYTNEYSNPLMAITKDSNGNTLSVTLNDSNGKLKTFRGNIADDIAYQIHLKEMNKPVAETPELNQAHRKLEELNNVQGITDITKPLIEQQKIEAQNEINQLSFNHSANASMEGVMAAAENNNAENLKAIEKLKKANPDNKTIQNITNNLNTVNDQHATNGERVSEETPEEDVAAKQTYIDNQKEKLKSDEDAQFDETLNASGAYDRIFGVEYELKNTNKIFENDTENDQAISKLSNEDNPEQEPNVKIVEEKERPVGHDIRGEQVEAIDRLISDATTTLIPETGISEEMRAKQRKELDIPEPAPRDKNIDAHTWEALNKEANRLVDSGEVDYNKLAQSIISGDIKPSDQNNAILNRAATELGNKIIDARAEVERARANGDNAANQEASDNYLQALSDLNNIHIASEEGLRIAARALASGKMSMKEDYTVGSLYTRFKKANGDKSLPREIIDRLDTYSAQIQELNVRIKAAEELTEAQGKQIQDIQKSKPSITKEKTDAIKEKRKALLNDWKKYKEERKNVDITKPYIVNNSIGGISLDTTDIKFAAKIALSYIEEGAVTTMEVSKKLKADVKDTFGLKLSDEDLARIFDTEIDGKKVVDNFENTGIPSSKQSLADIVNKAENDTKNIGKEKKQRPKQTEGQKALIQNTNKALNDLKIAREKLKRKVDAEQGAIEYANRSTSTKVKEGVSNVLNVPRSLMASFDFSAPLRQGLVASIAHPLSALKATKEMFKQFASAKNFEHWLINYKLSPEYELAKKSELYVADPSELHLNGKEEAFMSNLAEKIPLIKYGIKASERAYVGYLNKLRTDVFKNGSELLQEQGKTFETHPEDFKALADFVNSSTGRGKLPNKTIEDAAPLLNSLFFSPRLIASRINLLNPVYYAKMPPKVRIMALKDMAKFAGFATTILGIAKLSGAQVDDDPRSSDFGKIKVGDTRYDVLGGFQQYIRLVAQEITGEKKSTATGKIVGLNPAKFPYQSRGSVLGSFVRAKLAPATGIGIDFLTGRDAVGLPVTVKNELYTHFSPLQLQDGIQAYQKGGFAKVLSVLIPSMFGVGVQMYSSNKTKQNLQKEFEKMSHQ